MPDRESVAAEWVQKAENDLKNAAHVLKLAANCPTDTVCFHAQQCVEKYLKALLTVLRTDPPRTHDIEDLVCMLPPDLQPAITAAEQGRLTDYATVMRYPGDYEPIPLTEARRAVAMARRVRREVRSHLPPKAMAAKKR